MVCDVIQPQWLARLVQRDNTLKTWPFTLLGYIISGDIILTPCDVDTGLPVSKDTL